MLLPSFAMFAAACRRSVDLPMPGSPPIRIMEPFTTPPPRTRSISGNPVGTRTSCPPPISFRLTGRWLWEDPAKPRDAAPDFGAAALTGSSTMVFQFLHAGHCPTHFADS